MPRFYPPDAAVPERLLRDGFLLEPLHPRHTALDHAALMDSLDLLRRWSQTPWPTADFTLDENRSDLQHHWDEQIARVAFTYTVMDPAGDRCRGCVYIRSLESLVNWVARGEEVTLTGATSVPADSAVFTFWAREPEIAFDADRDLLGLMLDWLRGPEWAFQHVYASTNAAMPRQIALCEAAGLRLHTRLVRAGRADQLVYG